MQDAMPIIAVIVLGVWLLYYARSNMTSARRLASTYGAAPADVPPKVKQLRPVTIALVTINLIVGFTCWAFNRPEIAWWSPLTYSVFFMLLGVMIESMLGSRALLVICVAGVGTASAFALVLHHMYEFAYAYQYNVLSSVGTTFAVGIRAAVSRYGKSALVLFAAAGFSFVYPVVLVAPNHTTQPQPGLLGALAAGFVVAFFFRLPDGLRKAWTLAQAYPTNAQFVFDYPTQRIYYSGPALYAVESGMIDAESVGSEALTLQCSVPAPVS